MRKKINEIDNTWYEIQTGLQVADFLGASQRIRKMILQLKMLKLDIGILMDLPYPQVALSGRERQPENGITFSCPVFCTSEQQPEGSKMSEDGGDKCI